MKFLTAAFLGLSIVASVSSAALDVSGELENTPCRDNTGWNQWLEGVRQEALNEGVSDSTWRQSLPFMTVDQSIIRADQKQEIFQRSFLDFADKLISKDRLNVANAMKSRHRDLLIRLEHQFGIPAPVLLAFWGLESDFGRLNTPASTSRSVIRSVTTLAYDCRRAEFFRRQLIDALRVVERGDYTAETFTGAWAGEIGALQFTPSDYFNYAVDFDGDGRVDVKNSIPDTLATAANFLKSLGWKRGQPFIREVRVPAQLPWEEADIAINHPRSQWVAWGVRAANGNLPADNLEASLWLPMGRLGPAFLVYHNFKVGFIGWNSAITYITTTAYFATLIHGEPTLNRGTQVEKLSIEDVKELQSILEARGYDVGTVDGKLGAKSRQAVKQAQLKVGLPADSFPTRELLDRVRSSF